MLSSHPSLLFEFKSHLKLINLRLLMDSSALNFQCQKNMLKPEAF